jgi:hypothetical protein
MSWSLKSWVVATSLDGNAWTEIDRKTNNTDFKNRLLLRNLPNAVSSG